MRILTLLATLSITACGDERNGPASLGEPFTTSTAKVANPGDNEVEFITWYLPSEGQTTEITFVLLVPDCDAIGSCRWIPDVYGHNEHDPNTAPVRTVVQETLDICWLTDEIGKIVYNTNALPNGDGNVSFSILKSSGTVTLVCNVNPDAQPVMIGANLFSVDNHLTAKNGYDFVWNDTYMKHHAWSEPAHRVVIQ